MKIRHDWYAEKYQEETTIRFESDGGDITFRSTTVKGSLPEWDDKKAFCLQCGERWHVPKRALRSPCFPLVEIVE